MSDLTTKLGKREISKAHPLFEASGAIDELMALICVSKITVPVGIISDLFLIKKEILNDNRYALAENKERLEQDSVEYLEKCIASIKTYKSESNIFAPLAYAICQRAERKLIELKNWEDKNKSRASSVIPEGLHPDSDYLRDNVKVRIIIITYLNKLSKYLSLIS